MGLWLGTPDLNAIDYITMKPEPTAEMEAENFAVANTQFLPICSMNVAFKPEIIPAYYQLWHKDRFDDIFSGLFLKKIADHLHAGVSFGGPLVYHDKQERDLFKDAITELPAIRLNENLWMTLNDIRLTKKTWLECYRELALELSNRFREGNFADYIWAMTRKMLIWTETIEMLLS